MLYVALLVTAIALNWSYKKNLLLVLVVGLSGLLPMQIVSEWVASLYTAVGNLLSVDIASDYHAWWTICLGFESFKIFLAYKILTRLSYPIMFLCSLMLVCHLTLLFVDNLLPHKIIVPILEHLEILSCILFSPKILKYLKRKVTCQLRS